MWQDGNNKTTSDPAVSLLLNKVKLRITCNLFVIVCKQLQICCHLHSPKPWTQLTFRVQPFQWCCRKAISLQNDIGAWQPCFYTCLHPEYKRLATSWVESFIAKKTIAVVHTDLMQWKSICIYKLNSNYMLICIVAFTNLSESYWVQVGLIVWIQAASQQLACAITLSSKVVTQRSRVLHAASAFHQTSCFLRDPTS